MKKIIVTHDDYLLITKFMETNGGSLSRYSYTKLSEELKDAEVLENDVLPENVIGLHSEVEVIETELKQKMKIKLVPPKEANPKMFHISIFAPIGTALIGYEKGDVVEWEVGGKLRKFKILDVKNG